MRAKTVFMSLALVVLMTSLSLSQYSARENFAYPTGRYVTGQGGAGNGWADAWHLDPGDTGVSDSLLWVADSGISYQDMNYDYPHAGNVLVGVRDANKYARYERTLDKTWTPDAGTIYWFSVFMEVKNDTDVSTWAGVKLCQDHTDAAVMFGKGHGLDKYTCGGGWHGGPGPEVSSVAWTAGPVWLVGEIFNMGEGNQSPVYMWINPDPSTQPDTSKADARSTWAPNPGIAYVRVEYGGSSGFEAAFSDIRMGTTWGDVSSGLYIANESFAYPKGKYIVGQGGIETGWADAWHLDPGDTGVSDSLLWVADSGISYQDMNYDYPHTGNVLVGVRDANKYARYERTLDKTWTPDSGTIYWFSVFMEVKNDTDVSTWAGVKLAQDHTDAAIMFGKGHGLDKYTCGGGWHGGPGPEVSSVAWTAGPVWLVGEIFNMGAGNQSPAYMWINPDPSTQPDTSKADAKTTEALSPGISYVRVEYGGSSGFEAAFSDIRMGTTWGDVSSVLAVTGVSRPDINIPSQFALSQNYPNPFNPSTNIQYTLESRGKVRLAVYDLLGREVAVLVDGYQNVGTHQVVFSRAGLSSGIYFYMLRTANGVVTKKMVLLK
jgi:hypothetical protein